jgi:metallophosphoesterase superfamily enzyme
VVHGHVHPCLRWRGLAAPCYLVDPKRLVLPAFSGDAAGAGVLRSPRWKSYRCCVVAGDRVLDFGELGRLRSLPLRAAGLVPAVRTAGTSPAARPKEKR